MASDNGFFRSQALNAHPVSSRHHMSDPGPPAPSAHFHDSDATNSASQFGTDEHGISYKVPSAIATERGKQRELMEIERSQDAISEHEPVQNSGPAHAREILHDDVAPVTSAPGEKAILSAIRNGQSEEEPRRNVYLNSQVPIRDEDYTRKYPPDKKGMEIGPDGRVWKTYLDETEIADKDYLNDNNGTLDGILVFAAIFSAIVTTFVTQTYSTLLQDPQVALLTELIAIQRAAANGSSVNDIPSSDVNTPFAQNSSDVWINGLWFMSLMLSLVTAFLAVLAKQWLYQYGTPTSGSPRTRALIRQARNLGLQEWYIPTLIGVLPVVLYASLALYLAGLIILLRSIICNLAYFVASAVISIYTAYFVSSILPIFYPRCPYRTGLTPKLFSLYNSIPAFPFSVSPPPHEFSIDPKVWKEWKRWSWITWVKRVMFSIGFPKNIISWKTFESVASISTNGLLEGRAILWLHTFSYNPTAKQMSFQALAALPNAYDVHKDSWDVDMNTIYSELHSECTRVCSSDQDSLEVERELELYLRACMQISFMRRDSILLLDRTEHLRLPLEVRYFMYGKTIKSPSLNAITACGCFDFIFTKNEGSLGVLDFLRKILVDKTYPDPFLPTKLWTSILRFCRGSLRRDSGERLKLSASVLFILSSVGFFGPHHSIPLAVEGPPTRLHQPSIDMGLAMLNLMIRTKPVASPEDIPEALLEILWWLCDLGDELVHEELLVVTKVVMQCLRQTLMPVDSSLTGVWLRPTFLRTANDHLLTFLQSRLFESCILSETEDVNEAADSIRLDAYYVLRALFHHPYSLPWAPALRFKNYVEITLRCLLRSLAVSVSSTDILSDWVQSALENHDETYFAGIIDFDMIPALYALWLHAATKSNDFEWTPTAEFICDVYLPSIPPVRRSGESPQPDFPAHADAQIKYIHGHPENLYKLCCIFLQDPYDYRHNMRGLLTLLQLHPRHPSWTTCLNMLREEMAKGFELNGPLTWRTLKRIHDAIEDMQQILEIDQLDHPEWQQQYDEYVEMHFKSEKPPGPSNLRLIALYNESRVDAVDNDPVLEHKHTRWQDRLRQFLHFNRRIQEAAIQDP